MSGRLDERMGGQLDGKVGGGLENWRDGWTVG